MKAGDIYVVEAPAEEALHGRKFKLTRDTAVDHPIDGGKRNLLPAWVAVDVENSEERYFLPEHFSTMLKPA